MATKPTAAIARIQAANNNAYDETTNPGGLAEGGHRQNFVPDLQAVVSVGQWTEVLAAEVDADAIAVETARAQVVASTGAAATSATNAGNAATAAIAALDSFDDRYLGAKAANPTLDNDGQALLVGAMYFNTAAAEMRVWSGTAWGVFVPGAASYYTKAQVDAADAALKAQVDAAAVYTLPVQPSLHLVPRENDIPAGATFARNSIATRFNASGRLETVGPNVLRVNYDPVTGAKLGWLIEDARANLLSSSGDLRGADEGNPVAAYANSGPASACVGSVSTFKAPDDKGFYTRLLFNGSESTDRRAAVPVTGGQTICTSLFFKRGSLPTASIQMHITGGATVAATVGLTWADKTWGVTQSPTVKGGVIFLSDDEAFVWVSVKDDGDGSMANMLLQSTPIGTSGDTYVWGAQIEVGDYPSSYIPTTTAPAARATDVFSYPIGSWFNPDEFSVYVEVELDEITGYQSFIEINGGSFDRVIIRRGSDLRIYVYVIVANVMQVFFFTDPTPPSGLIRIAARFKSGDCALSMNGAPVHAEGGGYTLPALTTMHIGGLNIFGASEYMNGCVRRLAVFPRGVANSDLVTMASPTFNWDRYAGDALREIDLGSSPYAFAHLFR